MVYGAALHYGVKTYKLINENIDRVSARTIETQKQLTKMLIVQAIIPFITLVGPLCGDFLGILLGVDYDGLEITVNGCMSWIPVLDVLSTIIFIKPYRQNLLSFWKRRKSLVSHSSMSAHNRTLNGTNRVISSL
ncbi:unnamed protein product [Bursaphelenchus okinawaensis]|uniref:G protein-coupled receptor n=1 Tax=Bursaphelenchus okinawaensis TaxID=465554 RepID=A0A811KY95_9BILA|nr:unnamed protein product [Bursaphelenchus okinawaensis]CAG9114164.1 unnamed protein product [Bursaphelenchus okinawaensis]